MRKILLALLSVVVFHTQAGLIETDISVDALEVGERVEVSIEATGFTATSSFWFDFEFDTSLFALDLNSLSSDLTLVDTGLGIFDGLEVTTATFGLGFLFADSFTSVVGDFNLARFELIALGEGHSSFAITGIDSIGVNAPLTIDSAIAGSGQVNVTTVSEPGMVLLFLLSLLPLVLRRQS